MYKRKNITLFVALLALLIINSQSICDDASCLCTVVAGVSTCTACKSLPFFKIAPAQDRCNLCPGQFCLSCNGNFNCVQYDTAACIAARGATAKPNILGSACLLCGNANCARCLADNYCEQCNAGFLLNPLTGTCYQCPAGCKTCDPNTLKCLQCTNVFEKPNTAGTACVSCNIANCSNCDIAGVCTTCQNITFKPTLTGNACVQCAAPFCTRCSSPNVCAAYANCPVLGQLPNFAATACFDCQILNCASCSANGQCQRCAAGLVPSANKASCITCPASCSQCDTANHCISCPLAGYKPNLLGNNCFNCSARFCASCSDNNKCQSYFFCPNAGALPNVAATACYDCQILGCSHCKANNVCQTCSQIGFLPNAAGKACFDCQILNCASCSANNKCQKCAAGLRLASDGTCIKCPTWCAQCDRDDHCIACVDNDGYKDDKPNVKGNYCYECPAPLCANCYADYKCESYFFCQKPGYLPNVAATACYDCQVLNCLHCSGNNQCQKCDTGFVVSYRKDSCIKCDVQNCASCSSNNVCNYCKNGLVPSASGDACIVPPPPCPSWCRTCINPWTCAQCLNPFARPNSSGTYCFTCSQSNCQTCESSYTGCSSCKQGFRKTYDNKCV